MTLSKEGLIPFTPAGTRTPLVLIDFGFMLAGQTQYGNRKKKREKENKHETEDNTGKKFKPCGSFVRKQQAALDEKGKKKEESRSFNAARAS